MREVIAISGNTGKDELILSQGDAGRPGATTPLSVTERPDGPLAKETSERPGVSTENISTSERPGVSKDTGAGNAGSRIMASASSATDKLQWYHWLIISVLIAGIAYGAYYWYKKRSN